ncbi:MAG: hypothetical protein RLZZ338_3865 [Cyanobacteriota bacterium]|jgi:D-alanine-D-alanine ligase
MRLTYHFDLLSAYMERLYQKLRIAVIYGGDKNKEGSVIYKTHNPRSTKTYEKVAHDIANALENVGFEQVFVMADDITLAEKLKQENIHICWLNTGGVQGYNPLCHTPAILEMLGMPYVGHNPLNSSILDNKHCFKLELQALGFKTAPFMTWHPSQGIFHSRENSRFLLTFEDYSGPFLVKPISGRASLNIYFVETAEQLTDAVAQVHEITHNTALIETYLPGREFCVAVCGYITHTKRHFSKNSHPFAFSTIERILDPGIPIFTSMDQKAISTDRMQLLKDENLDIKHNLIDIAQRIYRDFSLNTLVRIDLRADDRGTLYILEANPKPDLTRPTENVTSLVVEGLGEYGMSYEDLILSLLADRLDYLLTYRSNTIAHIVELIQ